MDKAKTRTKLQNGTMLDCLKSTFIAVLISMVGILLLGIIVKAASLDDKITAPIAQIIKVVSILLGCIFGFSAPKSGLLKGAICGLLFALISFVSVAAVNKGFDFSLFSFLDMLACIVAGGVSGIIAVNIKNKK